MEHGLNLFVLGAPKSGTTAIAELLDAHPSIQMSKPKEPHFFDAHYREDLGSYLRSFFDATNEPNLLRGEATPSYLMIPWVAKRIAFHYPSAKLIVCLRNPVDRAFSSWWMQFARGLELLNFEDAIAAEKEQGDWSSQANAQEKWVAQIESISRGEVLPIRTYLETGLYHKHISRYLQFFPRENIHVVFSTDLRNSREKALDDIWKFLSVESDLPEIDVKETVNAAYGHKAVKTLRLLKKLKLMRLRGLVPISLREPIKARLSRLGSVPTMDQAMRKQLTDHFRESNHALEALLDVDLSDWTK